MSDPYIYQSVTLAAGVGEQVNITGNFIRILAATASPKVGIQDATPQLLPTGIGVPVVGGFTKLRIENPTIGEITVVLAIGDSAITDNRLNVDGSLKVRGGGLTFTDGETIVSNTAVELLAANANRTAAIIRAGAADLWLGPDDTLTVGTVPTLAAGTSMTIAHTGAVYARRAASGTVPAGHYEESA